MAAGLLAQVQSGAGFNAPGSNSLVAYTCPMSANYAVLHMRYQITCRAFAPAGFSTNSIGVQFFVGSYLYASSSTSSTNATPGSGPVSAGGASIMLGPGETITFTSSATGFGTGGNASCTYDILLTGYEG